MSTTTNPQVRRWRRVINEFHGTATYELEIWEPWEGVVEGRPRSGLRFVRHGNESHAYPLEDWEIKALSYGWSPTGADEFRDELPTDKNEIK